MYLQYMYYVFSNQFQFYSNNISDYYESLQLYNYIPIYLLLGGL